MSPQELFLQAVIADARAKGARIVSWHRAPNGRIFIDTGSHLPLYFLNMVAAADSLIHRYRLVSKYRHLYNRTRTAALPEASPSPSQNRATAAEKVVDLCQHVIDYGNPELSATEKNRIYQALYKTLEEESLNHASFFSLRHAMIDHYTDLSLSETAPAAREKLRRLIRLFEKMQFSDVSELY